MIQHHPPFGERLAANTALLAKQPQQAPETPAPTPAMQFNVLSGTGTPGSVHDMLASKAKHGMAALHGH